MTPTITLTETLVAQCSADKYMMTGSSETGQSATDPAIDYFTVTSVVTVTNTLSESNMCISSCAQSTLMATHVSVMETCSQATSPNHMQLVWMIVAIMMIVVAIAITVITFTLGCLQYWKQSRRVHIEKGVHPRKFPCKLHGHIRFPQH